MKLSMKKDDLLSNKSNKQHFLEKLAEKMNEGPISAVKALGDADRLIVFTGLGEDTDLLVLTL